MTTTKTDAKPFLQKIKTALKDRFVSVIAGTTIAGLSFVAGQVAQLYSTYTGLPERVGALEEQSLQCKNTLSDVQSLTSDLKWLKQNEIDEHAAIVRIESKLDTHLLNGAN